MGFSPHTMSLSWTRWDGLTKVKLVIHSSLSWPPYMLCSFPFSGFLIAFCRSSAFQHTRFNDTWENVFCDNSIDLLVLVVCDDEHVHQRHTTAGVSRAAGAGCAGAAGASEARAAPGCHPAPGLCPRIPAPPWTAQLRRGELPSVQWLQSACHGSVSLNHSC